MQKAVWIVLSAAVIASTGCGGGWQAQAAKPDPQAREDQPTEPAAQSPPPTPIAVQKAELGGDSWDPEWDKIVEESLPRDLLSPRRERQVKALCPRFRQMTETDRRAFWAYFFQALAGAEASLRPTADVRHTQPEVAIVDPVTHHIARQEGLLQLAYMDRDRYGCDFDWDVDKQLPEHDPKKTILLPKNNLECGIRIMDYQLMVLREPVLSRDSYWVTLRPGTPGFRMFKKQLANLPLACGASPYRREIPAAVASRAEGKRKPGNQVSTTARGAGP